ncbi:hypothetical protein DFJ63DRAFT_310835 [Scheffersomyces coipomensis]|uniref:uncharacterized protein n=1 Tax=Scheffersomyces coipomensis TaxID=1788519 RepID=UPI00315DE02F
MTSQQDASGPNDFISEFIINYMSYLPDDLILNILDQLDEEYINEVFLFLQPLNQAIISHYHGKRLNFVLAPSSRNQTPLSQTRKMNLITYYPLSSIEEFLQNHPHINTHTLTLSAASEFYSLRDLMIKYRHRFSNEIQNIEIYIEKFELSIEDFSFLLSFPNISRLYFARVSCLDYLTYEPIFNHLPIDYTSLKEIILLGSSVNDWSQVEFPSSVKHLDISWNDVLNPITINIPSSVEELYLNSINITNEVIHRLIFPQTLKNLTLTNNDFSQFLISKLPRKLNKLDISTNNIDTFNVINGIGWPTTLSALLMANCHINDTKLKQLSMIDWPQDLNDLVLNNNSIESFEYLQTLPDTLIQLNLQFTNLTTFKVNHDSEFFQFPMNLKVLKLAGTKFWYQNLKADTYAQHHRIVFPPNLVELDLSECKIDALQYFEFPESLTTLYLAHNKIDDICTYNSVDGSINWKQLSSLKSVDFMNNLINDKSLQQWIPPANLQSVDFQGNSRLHFLSNELPIFNEKYSANTSNLKSINFMSSSIRKFNPNIILPINLVKLSLSSGQLNKFHVSENLASHPNLKELDLSYCDLTSITFEKEMGHSNLSSIDLSHNLLLSEYERAEKVKQVAQFYERLQNGFGKRVKTRRHNINSKLEFID